MRADRIRCEYTQVQLAKLVGVCRTQITQMELGATEPSVRVLAALCIHLGTSTDWLLNIEFDDE